MFYCVGCCVYRDSLKTKFMTSGAKRLIVFENNVAPALNPTLNLNDCVNKSKWEIKTHLLKEPCHFSLLLQDFQLFNRDSFFRGCKPKSSILYQVSCRASLLAQESHTYGAGYVMQTSKCISFQIMHYGESVLCPLFSHLCKTLLAVILEVFGVDIDVILVDSVRLGKLR